MGHPRHEPYEVPDDPHLTKRGLEQAKAAGTKILSMIKDKKITNVRVVSSPFVRCLMTAQQIAMVLGAKQIQVDGMLSQFLCVQFFKNGNPMNKLHYRTLDSLKKYVELNLVSRPREQIHFPQIAAPYCNRIINVFREYEKQTKEGDICVLVSHGYTVQNILDELEQYDYQKGVDYCCLTGFQNGKIVLKQHHQLI